MKFIYDYELCALGFLLVIMVFYFIRRRLGSMTNRMYSLFLIAAFFNIILDIMATVLLNKGSDVPTWLNYLVNSLFYTFQMFVVYFGYLYTRAVTNKLNIISRRLILLTSLPCVIHIVISLTDVFTDFLFIIDENNRFSYGPFHILHYIFCFFYLIMTVANTYIYRKSLTSIQVLALGILGSTSLVFAVIQALFPAYLIAGVANVIAAFFMFLALQNPVDNIDLLTGCFNEVAFNQFYNRSFANKENYIYIAINITGLKTLNYTFGIENCDKLIRDVGQYLRGINERLMVFRISGSTFGVIMHTEEEISDFFLKFNNRFRRPWTICEVEVRLHTNSVRIDVPLYASNIGMLLYNTDYCLNMLENSSSDTYFCVNEKLYQEIQKSAIFEEAILNAIKHESFYIVYQPIFSIEEQRFVALEALVRLHDGIIGEVLPEVFLPIAEKNGHIIKIGSIVLNKVCDFIERNNPENLGFKYISINLSAPECMQDDLASQIYSVFDSYKMDPKYVYFDISESAAANAIEHLRVSMYRIIKGGCRFSLDDYGTGYSNLSGIIELPFSMVKIDRTLARNMENDTRIDVVMTNMIDMFKGLGLKILAEGIENEEQVNFMKKFGVDFIQGYYYSSVFTEEQLLETFPVVRRRIVDGI